jgi:hypothetical protein
MGGTGKTELVVRAADRLTAGYPDGRFWLGLRTYAPAESRMGTAEALRTLLNALGIPPDPQDFEVSQLSARWRSATVECRILLVLYVDAAIVSAVETLYRSGSVTGMSEGRPSRPSVAPPRHETDVEALAWFDRHQPPAWTVRVHTKADDLNRLL